MRGSRSGGGTCGFELAKQLQARGNTLIITGRNPERIEATRRALPGVQVFQSDASDVQAIAALHDQIVGQFPALDVLINNAGIMRNLSFTPCQALLDVTREIDINLSGPIRMTERFLPHLAKRPGALLINVTSGLAFIPFTPAPIYSATKVALHAFTQVLRAQLEGTGITVVELAPPGVETPLFRGEFEAETKGQKGMEVAVLAARAIAGIEAGKLEIRPGLSNVLKIMSRIAPNFMFQQLTKASRPKR